MNSELELLTQRYGLSKKFVNIYQSDVNAACLFSSYLEHLFSSVVEHKPLQELWKKVGSYVIDVPHEREGMCDMIVTMDTNKPMRAYHMVTPQTKSSSVLDPLFRLLRASWYAALINLLETDKVRDGKLVIKKERYNVAPLMLKHDKVGHVLALRKVFEPWQGKDPLHDEEHEQQYKLFNAFNLEIYKKAAWGSFNKKPYCLTWHNEGTNIGIFNYDSFAAFFTGCKWQSFEDDPDLITTTLQLKYREEHGDDQVMPTSVMYDELVSNKVWQQDWHDMLKRAHEQKKKDEEKKQQEKDGKESKQEEFEDERILRFGTRGQAVAVRIMIVALATLEMIIKDADADIVIRKGNRADFKACLKLLERVTLPKCFGIIFPKPLFDNYDKVEPCIGWNAVEG